MTSSFATARGYLRALIFKANCKRDRLLSFTLERQFQGLNLGPATDEVDDSEPDTVLANPSTG